MSGNQPGPRPSAFGNQGPFGNQSASGQQNPFGQQGLPQSFGNQGFSHQGGGAGGAFAGSSFGPANPDPFGAGGAPGGPAGPGGTGGPGGPFGGQPPPYQPQPPRKKGLPPAALTALIGGGVVAVALMVFVAFTFFGSEGPTAVPPPPATTQQTTQPPSPSAPPSSEDRPPPTYSFEPPTQSTWVPSDPPPSSRKPSGGDSKTYADHPNLTNNKIYQADFDSWSCKALAKPESPSGTKNFKPWMNGLVDCMMDRYAPVVKAAGGTLSKPKVIYFSGTIETPCGNQDDRVPFYCGSNQSKAIYLNPKVVERYSSGGIRFGAVHVLFHEFAHHVQHELGMINGGYAADLEGRTQISRRIELQAECFTFIQETLLTNPKWTSEDVRQFEYWFSEDQDEYHGKSESYLYWFKRVRGKGDMSLCNTWTAAKKRVA